MKDNLDKEKSTDEVQTTREYNKIPAGDMDFVSPSFCRHTQLPRANHSSRAVLPTVWLCVTTCNN
jgi:hypothetical protein